MCEYMQYAIYASVNDNIVGKYNYGKICLSLYMIKLSVCIFLIEINICSIDITMCQYNVV